MIRIYCLCSAFYNVIAAVRMCFGMALVYDIMLVY